MTDQPDYLDFDEADSNPFARPAPTSNRALIAHIRAGGSMLTFPRQPAPDMSAAIDRALHHAWVKAAARILSENKRAS